MSDDADIVALFERLPDDAARAELVARFQPLAFHLAKRYAGRPQDLDDLRQVASLGLLNAIDRFDVSYGSRFVSFAVPTIVGELKRYFRDYGWGTTVPRRLKEARVLCEKANVELAQRMGRSPTVEEIAAYTGLPREDVVEAAALGSAYRPDELDRTSPDKPAIVDTFGAEDGRFDLVLDLDVLGSVLENADARTKELLYLRFVEDLTQRQIGDRLGISQMHVSRLLNACLTDFRARLLA